MPPAHVQTHQWFKNKQLTALNVWSPEFDPDLGLPKPTAGARPKPAARTTVLPFTDLESEPPLDAKPKSDGPVSPLIAPDATITLPNTPTRPKGKTALGPSIGIGDTP